METTGTRAFRVWPGTRLLRVVTVGALSWILPTIGRAQWTVVDAGTTQSFTLAAGASTYAWTLDGAAVATTTATYAYAPDISDVGTHLLSVVATPASGAPATRQWAVRTRIPVPASPTNYYVSPTGSDSNPGTIGAPFLTLEKARTAIRSLARPLSTGGVTVFLRGGTYPRTGTFALTSADSGTATAPIIYTGYSNETAIISGGKPLLASAWSPLAASEVPRVAPGVDTTRIWETDSSALTHKGPFSASFNEWPIYNALNNNGGNIGELYYNDKRMWLSRYPNHNLTDETQTPTMLMNGVVLGSDGATYLNGAGNYTTSAGTTVAVGGAFKYNSADAAHVARWQTAFAKGGVWLQGYWRVAWQINGAQLLGVDTGNSVIEIAPNGAPNGGIGDKYTRPVGSKKEPFWVMNLLEEIDQPGEWAVDFSRNKIYFLMDVAGAPPDNSVALSDMDAPLVQVGGSYTTFQSLTFEQGLGTGVQILNGTRDVIMGCQFRNLGNMAVDINGGSTDGVVSCNLSDMGAGGIMLRGGSESGARTAARHFAVNNRVQNFARVTRVYEGGVDAGYGGPFGTNHEVSVGMRVAHNTISGTPHGGVFHGSFDNVYEYNDISNFCQFSNDIGGFYCYATSTNSANGTFRYNYVHDSAIGDSYYFDEDHVNMHLYGNISQLKTAASASQGFGFWYKNGTQATAGVVAQTLDCHDNISIADRYGFTFVAAQPSVIQNNVAVANLTTPYTWSLVTPNASGNVITTSNSATLSSGSNMTYTTDPGFLGLANNDVRLLPTCKIYTDLPTFQTLPVEMIGVYDDEYRSDASGHTPYIANGAATVTGNGAASLSGTLVYPAFDGNTSVTLYWGTTDGGTNAGSWQGSTSLGVQPAGTVTASLSQLNVNSAYYYRFLAANPYGQAWAPASGTFKLTVTAPVGGAATASTQNAPNESAAMAFDGSTSTKWYNQGGGNTGWLQYQFANGGAFAVTAYKISSANDVPGRDPKSWQVLGSNDGSTWTVIDAQTGQTFAARYQTNSYACVNTTTYQYYRLNVTQNNGDATGIQLSEWQLSGVPSTPVVSVPGNMTVEATGSNGAKVTFTPHGHR